MALKEVAHWEEDLLSRIACLQGDELPVRRHFGSLLLGRMTRGPAEAWVGWLHGASCLLLFRNLYAQGLLSGAWESWHFGKDQGRGFSNLRFFSKPKIRKM